MLLAHSLCDVITVSYKLKNVSGHENLKFSNYSLNTAGLTNFTSSFNTKTGMDSQKLLINNQLT